VVTMQFGGMILMNVGVVQIVVGQVSNLVKE